MKISLNIRRSFLFVILIIGSTISRCQIYKYIGLEDGLNNQKIYHIQKDQRGYMWFLTQEGVDRYDGKHIKHYNFSDDSMKLDSRIALNWLYMDTGNVLWIIGQKGRIFKYDSQHDKFKLVYAHPELIRNKSQAFLNHAYLDKNDRIWLCCKDSITWYDIRTGTTLHIPTPVNGEIATIEQTDDNHFFIGTGSGLFRVRAEKTALKQVADEAVKNIDTPIHELYYHAVSKQLFIGNYKEGILVYDIGKTGKVIPCQSPNNVEVNQIVALNPHELLVATGGKGVYKLNVDTYMSEPYITADYSSYNGMNGNNINDIYVDEEERIWLANYPTGITIRNNRFRYYDPNTGNYLNQDPIGLAGGNPTLYGYVFDPNTQIDPLGLDCSYVSKDFKNGASFLITKKDYLRFIAGKKKVGRVDGQFVIPKKDMDNLLKKSNGDIAQIEKALGIPEGNWQDKGGLVRVDIPNPEDYNLRLPTANMSGANEKFELGGKTSGGIPEGVIDQVPKINVIITKL